MAREQGLDLVEVSPNAKPPVVKLTDYGKFKYDAQKKANEIKKRQATIQLKEIQFRPNIEEHDLNVKMGKVRQFLERGDKVKMVMQFRGREMAYKQAGEKKFTSIIKTLDDIDVVTESAPKFMGNRIITIVAPGKKIKKKTVKKKTLKKIAKTTKTAKTTKKSTVKKA